MYHPGNFRVSQEFKILECFKARSCLQNYIFELLEDLWYVKLHVNSGKHNTSCACKVFSMLCTYVPILDTNFLTCI